MSVVGLDINCQLLPASTVDNSVPLVPPAQPWFSSRKKTACSEAKLPTLWRVHSVWQHTGRQPMTNSKVELIAECTRAVFAIGRLTSCKLEWSKDSREACDRSDSHNFLQRLQFIAGYDYLIAGYQIRVVRRFALVNSRYVHWNSRQHAVGLPPEDNDLALVARGQDSACLRQSFRDGKSMIH